MRRGLVLIIALVLSVVACGPAEFTQDDPTTTTAPLTTTQPPNGEDHAGTTIPGDDDGEVSLADHPGWIEERWPVLEGVDPRAAAWGDPGMVVLGYTALHRDDSPVSNGLWFYDGSTWHETLIRDVVIADQWGFDPDVVDVVWFGERYLAFLMGDTTTTPGRGSMLASGDGINWTLEYLGSAPSAALPAGRYATPESPPYPGTSAITRVAVTDGRLSAVGWTALDTEQAFLSVPVIWQSTDGRNWSTRVLPNANFDAEWGSDIAVGSLGYLVEAAGPVHQSAYLWFSPDGDRWTYIGDRFDDQWRVLTGMAVSDQAMLALMQDLETEGEPLSLWRSTNGLDWQEVPAPFLDAQYVEGWRLADVTADQSGLIGIAVRGRETQTWRSSDALEWTQLTSVAVPAGQSLIRTYPLWPQATVTTDRLELVATTPGVVLRWTEATE